MSVPSRPQPMPVPLPRDGWASWSACTSSRAPPTTSRRFFRSARLLPAERLQRRSELLQQAFVADDEQRLRGRVQHVVDVAAVRAQIDLPAVREQMHSPPAARRLVQPDSELGSERMKQQVELVDREAPSPQIGEYRQLEEIDRRVAALRVAARLGAPRRNCGRYQPARAPDLQLPPG